jgi:dephospho-CoA kinase
VYVSAPHDLRLLRRSERGDIATQADTNDPDVKAFSEEDPVIINTSDISELKSQVMSLIACSTS